MNTRKNGTRTYYEGDTAEPRHSIRENSAEQWRGLGVRMGQLQGESLLRALV